MNPSYVVVFVLIVAGCMLWLNHSIREEISNGRNNSEVFQWLQQVCQRHGGTGDNELGFESGTSTDGYIHCYMPKPQTPKAMWVQNDFLPIDWATGRGQREAFITMFHAADDVDAWY